MALCGFQLGNRVHTGCLTSDESVRLHSCEHGTRCRAIEASSNVVWITPSITRWKEGDVPEIGAGGGSGDLTQSHELEVLDSEAGRMLLELCAAQIMDTKLLMSTMNLIEKALDSGKRAIALDLQDASLEEDTIPLENLARLLSTLASQEDAQQQRKESFPYSRHSSYEEMCHLLSVFKPRDVYPCVTDRETWTRKFSMEGLFSHLCSGDSFCYDREMLSNHDINDDLQFASRAQQKPSSQISTLTHKQEQSDVYSETGLKYGSSKVDRSMLDHTRDEDAELSLRKRSNCEITDGRPWKKAQMSASKTSAQQTLQKEATALPESLSGWLRTSDPAVVTTKRSLSKKAEDFGAKALPQAAAGTQCDSLELSDASRSETASEEETACMGNVSKPKTVISKSETKPPSPSSACKTKHLDRAPLGMEHCQMSASPQKEDDEEL
ncbi:MAG: hypothetical protein LQ352_001340 [Teloschistes flavicans]|nr:MAG: hypothetical protein LQ352_001340 [Teloschistes flavicans]